MAKRRLNNKLILAIYHIAARQKFVGIVTISQTQGLPSC